MRILIVGASGTIGKVITLGLADRHEIIQASRFGDERVDITDADSIRNMYERVSNLDAVICVAGMARRGRIDGLSDKDIEFSIANKMVGQINLVRIGRKYLNTKGSFTLTSGLYARKPAANAVMLTTVNAAVEGFVRAAALDMPRAQRLNAVSPPMVKETAEKRRMKGGMPAAELMIYYNEAIEGDWNGQVIKPA